MTLKSDLYVLIAAIVIAFIVLSIGDGISEWIASRIIVERPIGQLIPSTTIPIGHRSCEITSSPGGGLTMGCVLMPGSGKDECNSDADCTHTSCVARGVPPTGNCETVFGLGKDECTYDADCNHLECDLTKKCITVPGPGTSTCGSDADCKLKHTVCVLEEISGAWLPKCELQDGAGTDDCKSTLDCYPTTTTTTSSTTTIRPTTTSSTTTIGSTTTSSTTTIRPTTSSTTTIIPTTTSSTTTIRPSTTSTIR